LPKAISLLVLCTIAFVTLRSEGNPRARRPDSQLHQRHPQVVKHRDGFLLLPHFVAEAKMANIEAAITRYVREVVPQLPADYVFCKDGGGIRSMNQLEEHDAFFATFKQQPRFLQLAAELFATDAPQIISDRRRIRGDMGRLHTH
jgi:hypothetical protein